MTSEAVCARCGGTGFIVVEHANLSSAEPCECRAQLRAAGLQDKAQIPPLYQNASFDSFKHLDDPLLRRIMNDVSSYAASFAKLKKQGLLLTGEPGTGKTHLAVAALRRIMSTTGFEGLFCDYQNLLDRIRSGYDPASNSSDRHVYQSALDAPILLLDDLGAHRVTDWVMDTVTSIITYRCNNQKPLIATTNLAMGAERRTQPDGTVDYRITLVDRIGERALSRLFEMCTHVDMRGVEDFRRRKARV